jgi:small subunit ribosomal protein S4
MIIGPKYKIARRLGAPVFEFSQIQKYVLSQARKEKSGKSFSRPKSEFGLQLLEKQKARFTYCMTEKQFSRSVKEALSKKDKNAVARLYTALESRADNVAYRAGFAPTRLAARQMISHGHMTVNGKRITIPSMKLSMNDILGIRPGSVSKPLFASLDERLKTYTAPAWIAFNFDKKEAKIQGEPKYSAGDSMFDINAILEFYSR